MWRSSTLWSSIDACRSPAYGILFRSQNLLFTSASAILQCRQYMILSSFPIAQLTSRTLDVCPCSSILPFSPHDMPYMPQTFHFVNDDSTDLIWPYFFTTQYVFGDIVQGISSVSHCLAYTSKPGRDLWVCPRPRFSSAGCSTNYFNYYGLWNIGSLYLGFCDVTGECIRRGQWCSVSFVYCAVLRFQANINWLTFNWSLPTMSFFSPSCCAFTSIIYDLSAPYSGSVFVRIGRAFPVFPGAANNKNRPIRPGLFHSRHKSNKKNCQNYSIRLHVLH